MNFPPPTDKQARLIWLSLTALAVVVLLAALGVLLWGFGFLLKLLSPVLWPVAIAGVLAYLLDPVVDFLERRNMSRRRAILLVFLCATALAGGLLANIVPRLVFEASDLVTDIPDYTRQIQSKANDWLSKSSIGFRFGLGTGTNVSHTSTNLVPTSSAATNVNMLNATNAPALGPAPGWEKRVTESAIAWVTAALPKIGKWILTQASHVASWAGMLVGLAMVPVFAFYFLDEKRGIQAGWQKYLPVQESKFKDELVFVLNAINDYLIVFFRGQVVVAGCIGVLLWIGFAVLGLNYSLLLGVLAGVLSIVPYLGAILTVVPAMILAAVQFRDWLHPVLVVGVFALVQMAEGFLISPKIMGDRVGLHPLTIIVALLVGTTLLGGILGGVLAIPLTAALRVVMFRYVWKPRR